MGAALAHSMETRSHQVDNIFTSQEQKLKSTLKEFEWVTVLIDIHK